MTTATSSGSQPFPVGASGGWKGRVPGGGADQSRPGQPSSELKVASGLLLIVIVAVAFFPASDIYLIGDDFEWLASAFEILRDPLSSFDRVNSMCRPVVKWSFLADYLVYGSHAVGYMFTNLLIHSLNTVLLFLLLTRMVRSPMLAAGAAAAFALSPLHSEAVLWASSRGDTLLLTSWLGALLILRAEPNSPSRSQMATVTILVLIGAGTKESWVVFPFIATAYVVLVLGRPLASAARILRWAWLALVLYLCVFVVIPAALGETTPAYYADTSFLAALDKVSRLLLMFFGLGGLQLTAIGAVGIAGAIAVVVMAHIVRAGNRCALWSVIWTVSTLALAAPFPDMALRHNYLPLAGFWMTFALVGGDLIGDGEPRLGHGFQRSRDAAVAVVVVMVLLIEGLVLQREIDDYRCYGNLHRQIADEFLLVKSKIPRDRPLFFVDLGLRNGVEEAIDLLQGVEKTFFVRPGAICQLVYLPSLANFLGEPLTELLRPIPSDDVSAVLSGDVTVLVFTDRGFRVTLGIPEDFVNAVTSHGRLPDSVSLYRFEAN